MLIRLPLHSVHLKTELVEDSNKIFKKIKQKKDTTHIMLEQ